MKRVIVDYSKLTDEILNLLVERFPDGYDDSHIVRFRNAQNELIEAVEVRTSETVYLVKVSTKLANRLENFEEEEEEMDDVAVPIENDKPDGIAEDEDDDLLIDDDEEEIDITKDPGGSDDDADDEEDDDLDDEDGDHYSRSAAKDDDEDEEDEDY